MKKENLAVKIFSVITVAVMAVTTSGCASTSDRESEETEELEDKKSDKNKELSLSITIDGYKYKGTYTGKTSSGEPDGEGTFSGKSSDGGKVELSGDFESDSVVRDAVLEVTYDADMAEIFGISRSISEGDFIDGFLEGDGKQTSYCNENNEDYEGVSCVIIEGNFVHNLAQGEGEITIYYNDEYADEYGYDRMELTGVLADSGMTRPCEYVMYKGKKIVDYGTMN